MQRHGQCLAQHIQRSVAAPWVCSLDRRTYAAQASRLSNAQQPYEDHAQPDTATRRTDGNAPAWQTHVPLNGLQRGSIALLSALGAVSNPARADLVAALGETTGQWAFERMRARMMEDATGRRILVERPRVTNSSVEHAWALPPSTFGGAYAKFMGDRNFQADDRPPVRFLYDEELAYVAQRSREVHDFWHVLFGCHTNVFGELALKAVEFVQTGLPMTALSVVGAQWRLKSADRAVLIRDFLPWAVRAGARSADLMCLYYEEHFQDDLEELRAKWRIQTAPAAPTPVFRHRSAQPQL